MSFTSILAPIPAPFSGIIAPPGATSGNGWEIRVLSSADYATVLAIIPRYNTWQFAKMLNDKGSGNIAIKLDDAIFSKTLGDGSPGTNLLDDECLWQFYLNGRLVFDFLGETITEQLVDSSEQIMVTVTGPGTIATLGWALAMPPGFPTVVFKTDAIADTFSEVDVNGNPLLDLSLWNLSGPLADITLNPLGNFNTNGLTFSSANPFGAIEGTCQITGTPGGTVLGGGPYDITNSVLSAQVAPMTGTGLDGSQVSQMYIQNVHNSNYYALIGLSSTQFYCQLGDTTGVKTKTLGTYDPNNDAFWMITEVAGYFYFWASSDGTSWTELWSIPHHFDASRVNVFFSAIYDQAGGAAVGISSLNSNVTTPTTTGNIFLEEPVMSIWYQLLTTAQARGTIPFLTTRLNSVNDSFLNPWTDQQSAQIANGTDLYSLLQTCAAIVNADFRMQPGFSLEVGLPLSIGGGTSLGRDLSHQIIFHEGDQVLTKQRTRARDQIQNLIGAVNQDGTVVTASVPSSITTWNQREGWVTTGNQITPDGMQIVATASVDASSMEQLTWTLSIRPDKAGCIALQDFDVGDWIGLERPFRANTTSVTDAVRVIGIAYSSDPTGLITCELTLVSYRQFLEEQLTYIANKFGGQFISALGASLLTAVPVQQTGFPFVINPDLGGLTDVTIA